MEKDNNIKIFGALVAILLGIVAILTIGFGGMTIMRDNADFRNLITEVKAEKKAAEEEASAATEKTNQLSVELEGAKTDLETVRTENQVLAELLTQGLPLKVSGSYLESMETKEVSWKKVRVDTRLSLTPGPVLSSRSVTYHLLTPISVKKVRLTLNIEGAGTLFINGKETNTIKKKGVYFLQVVQGPNTYVAKIEVGDVAQETEGVLIPLY